MSSIEAGKKVFQIQSDALKMTAARLGATFDAAVEMMLGTQGRIIVSGMGKSGIIGNKIAATLASTGTPSFSVHPAEAYHGDLGMFTPLDVALLISYSGETEEVIRLIPSLRHFGVKIIAIVGNPESSLGRNSDLVLDVSVEREACPNNLAPTTSTTVALAMGDAIAVALIEKRGFKPHDFAVFHPGGSLGRRLLTRVRDVMHVKVPVNNPLDTINDVIITITRGELGLTVVANSGKIVGVITDGDLRRALFNHKDISSLSAQDVMTRNPLTINDFEMFSDAENIMLKSNVTALLVVDGDNALVGVLKLQDAGQVN
ncbi:KpsF/GutQ family sugar-phosphate isomerase [Halomonas heilongjiangensis]|uniref:Arabinose 5-phosphate isomerase n=1 Tax=Halomonas heilongjiangensis TaxID=1387883 RepID=A0A2N7TMG0_9GAMM|nr:KpsF/GutQ family sugar-phosphate isomerase [Halomonas heilongjiangensis]PMR69374.1 KpsF/GutQ family sugar-phosphate isomerase [Halomonas heilongjiangensis]PXX90621.1 KpsF/GutQ family sugar-phosphate isomerase [Halomonas heilongjiangensis]